VLVATLGEVHAVLKVTTAQVKTDGHVGGSIADAVVVKLDVLVEKGGRVDALRLHALEHGSRAEVGCEKVVQENGSEKTKLSHGLPRRGSSI
jgi:hypothetical protein